MPFQKKVWQFNDIITEGELNRMEQGIEDSITAIEEHTNNTNNPHGVTAEQIGAETPAGAQAKADAALASAKDYTDQQISAITPEQIGAETPTGAQEKANQAEANAKAYADTVANSALALGKSYTDQNLATHEGKTASTSQKGHVQLSSSLTSTSETTAATSNAVKQLNDKITTLNNTVAALYVTNEATGKKYTLHFDDIGLYLKEV